MGPAAPRLTDQDYPRLSEVPVLQESRLVIWVIAQQLTYWGGFVFGGLFLATLLEVVGLSVREKSNAARYDSYARETLKLVRLALPVSILLGILMLGGLVLYYPGLFAYLAQLFRPILVAVSLVLFLFPIAVWTYERAWMRLASTGHRWNHAAIGLGVNVLAALLLVLANSWSSFMLSPAGVDDSGRFLGNYWHLLRTATWNVSTLHRFLANIAFAAAVTAGYSAYRSMIAQDPDRRLITIDSVILRWLFCSSHSSPSPSRGTGSVGKFMFTAANGDHDVRGTLSMDRNHFSIRSSLSFSHPELLSVAAN